MSVSSYKIQRLLPRHFKIVELAAAGHTYTTIARILGMNPRSVGLILRSPLVQPELARMRGRLNDSEILKLDREATLGKARSILESSALKAAQRLNDLMDSKDDSVSLRAADKILDRVFGRSDENRGAVVNITNEQINLLVTAMKESEHETKLPNRRATEAPHDESNHVPQTAQTG